MIRAFLHGIADGWRSPRHLGAGRGFGESPNDPRNNRYDQGVNVGQILRAPLSSECRPTIGWRPR